MHFVDLHTHSTASDGTYTPAELVRAAVNAGLVGLALTDHDTGNGLLEAGAEATRLGLRFVPGIEISADYPSPGTMHILGHFIDPQSDALNDMSRILLEGRNARNPQIIQRLNQLGCSITMAQVEAIARAGVPAGAPIVVGRPHIAQALVQAGCVANMKQAFDVYLGTTGEALLFSPRNASRRARRLIAFTKPVAWPHWPIRCNYETENPAHLQTVINHLAEAGLDGIEVYHCDQTERDSAFMLELAKRYNLIPTGGSDFHGHNKADVILGRGRNNVKVPVELLNRLEECWKKRRHAEFV